MILEKEFEEYIGNCVDKNTAHNYINVLKNLDLERKDVIYLDKNELRIRLAKFIKKRWIPLFAIKHLLSFYNRRDVFLPRAKEIKQPRKIKKKSVPFSAIKKAINHTKKTGMCLMIMLQYETAARISELLTISKDDIDFQNKQIVIGGLKGSDSRTIKLTDKTFGALKSSLPHPFIHKYDYYDKGMKEAFGNAKISTHWLRFSRAVHLFDKGYDVISIKNLLGHKKLDSTYQYLKEAGVELKELLEKEKPDW